MNLTKKRQLVLNVINANPGCQNDAADLIAAVWRTEGWNDARSLEDNLRKVTRPETITRRCRELHEAGLITYSKEANDIRMEAFTNERDAHSTFTPGAMHVALDM